MFIVDYSLLIFLVDLFLLLPLLLLETASCGLTFVSYGSLIPDQTAFSGCLPHIILLSNCHKLYLVEYSRPNSFLGLDLPNKISDTYGISQSKIWAEILNWEVMHCLFYRLQQYKNRNSQVWNINTRLSYFYFHF